MCLPFFVLEVQQPCYLLVGMCDGKESMTVSLLFMDYCSFVSWHLE